MTLDAWRLTLEAVSHALPAFPWEISLSLQLIKKQPEPLLLARTMPCYQWCIPKKEVRGRSPKKSKKSEETLILKFFTELPQKISDDPFLAHRRFFSGTCIKKYLPMTAFSQTSIKNTWWPFFVHHRFFSGRPVSSLKKVRSRRLPTSPPQYTPLVWIKRFI